MSRHFEKANTLYENKEYEEAIIEYDKAFKERPTSVQTLYNKAVCLIKLKRHEESIDALKQVIKINNMHYKAVFNLGYCNSMLGNHKLAFTYFKAAQALNDDDDCKKAIRITETKLFTKEAD